MLEINPHYQTTTPEEARKHILALVPINQRNQFAGLLTIYQNSIIQALMDQINQAKQD